MKIFKQSVPAARVEIFLALLMVCCLCAMGSLVAVVYLKGWIIPFATAGPTATPLGGASRSPSAHTSRTGTPVPVVYASLTPLPGQWTDTPTPLPGQSTKPPSRTPVQRTIAPSVVDISLSSTPTWTPILPDTLTPEADVHLREVQVKFVAFQVAYSAFSELHQQIIDNPTLANNEKWKIEMAAALSKLEEAANQLTAVELPDPYYAVYASYLDQLAAETGFMVTAYRKVIDHYDSTSMQIVIVHLQDMNETLDKAAQEYRDVKSRFATPAFPLVSSLTPTP